MSYTWTRQWNYDLAGKHTVATAEVEFDGYRRITLERVFDCGGWRARGPVRFRATVRGVQVAWAPSVRGLLSKLMDYHERTKDATRRR